MGTTTVQVTVTITVDGGAMWPAETRKIARWGDAPDLPGPAALAQAHAGHAFSTIAGVHVKDVYAGATAYQAPA